MTQNKVQPPTHGPYARRAQLVADALAALIQGAFGKRLQPVKRGADQRLIFTWMLPANVKVVIEKAVGNGDPSIWIRREDPHGRVGVLTDWKAEEVTRSYKDKCYDLADIMTRTQAAVKYNQTHVADDEKNSGAMAKELEGIPVPDDVVVTRNPQTGRYTVGYTVSSTDIELSEAKKLIVNLGKVISSMSSSPSTPEPKKKEGASQTS